MIVGDRRPLRAPWRLHRRIRRRCSPSRQCCRHLRVHASGQLLRPQRRRLIQQPQITQSGRFQAFRHMFARRQQRRIGVVVRQHLGGNCRGQAVQLAMLSEHRAQLSPDIADPRLVLCGSRLEQRRHRRRHRALQHLAINRKRPQLQPQPANFRIFHRRPDLPVHNRFYSTPKPSACQ